MKSIAIICAHYFLIILHVCTVCAASTVMLSPLQSSGAYQKIIFSHIVVWLGQQVVENTPQPLVEAGTRLCLRLSHKTLGCIITGLSPMPLGVYS